MRARPWSRRCRRTSTRSPARACTSSPSTTTSRSTTPSGWAGSTTSSASTVGMILPEMTPDERRDGLRRRHHLRHQQRVRLRLPARQHGRLHRGVRPARPQLRDRRRGRLDPHRRGPHAADHLRPDPGRGPVVRRVRRDRAQHGQGHRLRGRREEAHDLGPRARHHQGRGPPRHRQPLRLREHAADLVHEQRDQGQGAVPQRQGVRRHRRRGAHRRRAHRPDAARAAATTRACTRRSRPRRACRSARSTRPSRPSRCRTTSGSTTSSAA